MQPWLNGLRLLTANRERFFHVTTDAIALISVVCWLILAPPTLAKESWQDVERIIAIGDLHGDHDGYLKTLAEAQLIDESGNWSGGRTHLVQLGDIPDRGPDSYQILLHLNQLQKQARRTKGQVHMLIGNHEAMNILGDLRYVHPGEYSALITADSQRLWESYYQQNIEWLRQNRPRELWPDAQENHRENWLHTYPLGYVEHRMKWGRKGEIGRWILKQNSVIRINDSLFLHGGIGPRYAGWTMRELNRTVVEELADPLAVPVVTTDEEGPLWYRGLATHDHEVERPNLERLLHEHQAERIVIGHTPKHKRIMSRFEGRVILADTGAAKVYGGHRSFLEITSRTVRGFSEGRFHPVVAEPDVEASPAAE